MSNVWTTNWTGAYPNLCTGEWILYKNGEKVDTDIPFQGNPAYTRDQFASWGFDEDWDEVWTTYENGLLPTSWINDHKEWLQTITDEREWIDIYVAFNANDWRHNSCGGCI